MRNPSPFFRSRPFFQSSCPSMKRTSPARTMTPASSPSCSQRSSTPKPRTSRYQATLFWMSPTVREGDAQLMLSPFAGAVFAVFAFRPAPEDAFFLDFFAAISSLLLLLFEHGQDVSGGVLEPCDLRSAVAVNAFLVRRDLALVMLEADSAPGQIVHRFLDVVDGEIQDGKCCGRVVRLRVNHDSGPLPDVQPQKAVLVGDLETQGLFVEFFRLPDVLYRKPAERLLFSEHPHPPSGLAAAERVGARPPPGATSVRLVLRSGTSAFMRSSRR